MKQEALKVFFIVTKGHDKAGLKVTKFTDSRVEPAVLVMCMRVPNLW